MLLSMIQVGSEDEEGLSLYISMMKNITAVGTDLMGAFALI